jgi:hypothetical protein
MRTASVRRMAPLALLAVLLVLSLSASAGGEVIQRGTLRVSVTGDLTPRRLPRAGLAPVAVAVGAKIGTTDGATPAQLQGIAIAINRAGRLDAAGLPVCRIGQIQPTTNSDALAACGRSLVGEGSFSAKILLSQQAPFPSSGKVLAFSGTFHGRPAILAHVYGTEPLPTSFTLPFTIAHTSGTYGTLLKASLPAVTSSSGYVTGLSLTLGRTFTYRGRARAYLSAACAAPPGFPGASFPLAHVSMSFADGHRLATTLVRHCEVVGG